jgi:SAM-dependent methyltransferase
VWLAEHGWTVTAVDRSPIAIPTVDTHVADLEKHEFAIGDSAWDLIAVCYYLQRDLFEPVKRGLKPGGVAIAIVHMFEPGHEQSRFSLHPGELAKYFEGWEISHYHEGKSSDPDHHRAVAELVATRR